MNTLLAIETTQGPCSVAVYDATHCIAYEEEKHASRQMECLLSLCKAALTKAFPDYSTPEALGRCASIAVNIGPGSFASIRAGIAAAHGLSLVTTLPMIGVSSLQSLAAARWLDRHRTHHACDRVWVLMHARRGHYYVQAFDQALCPDDDALLIAQDALCGYIMDKIVHHQHAQRMNHALVGCDDDLVLQLSTQLTHPLNTVFTGMHQYPLNAHMIARTAMEPCWHHRMGNGLLPLYIREPDATLPTIV